MKKLGFGLMRLPLTDETDPGSIDYERVSALVDAFLARGFTYFDTAYAYHGGKSESVIRRCLAERYPRDAFFVTDKMPVWLAKTPEDFPRLFAQQLERCGLTYFDGYLLHALGQSTYDKTREQGGFDFLKQMKAEGKIRHMGISYHDDAALLDRILKEQPELELVQMQINYLDWESETIQARRCYETAERHGKKVVVMEPVKGGILARLPEETERAFRAYRPGAGAASWALRFAASVPAVEVVLSGMSDEIQLRENMDALDPFVPLDGEERRLVQEAARQIGAAIAIPCTACRYCVEDCPQNIAIPAYFALYNDQKQFGMGLSTRSYYGNLNRRYGRASDCVGCGLCEGRCPQHIEIRKYLAEVAEVFGK